MNNRFEIQPYLKRIAYQGNAEPGLETLASLMSRHVMSVPYENLDILAKIPLSLDTDALYDKIVTKNRGGYCFELNALFNRLLTGLGYKTETYFARFLLGETVIPMRRHRIMTVRIGAERYVADVGVGIEVPLIPLPLAEGIETQSRGVSYFFTRDGLLGWILWAVKKDAEPVRLYSFTEEPQFEIDFVQPNFFCQYAPESIFNKSRMISLKTPSGRMTVDGNTFKIFDGDKVTAADFGEEEIKTILAEKFGLVM